VCRDFAGPQNDERRQAKRNDLADKLTVEAKILTDLKVEKASARHCPDSPVRSTFDICRGDAIERHSGCGPSD
jgi:hypothetical protein